MGVMCTVYWGSWVTVEQGRGGTVGTVRISPHATFPMTYRDVVAGHMCLFDPNAGHRPPARAVRNSCQDGHLEVTAAITIRTDCSDKHPPKRRYTASGYGRLCNRYLQGEVNTCYYGSSDTLCFSNYL